eukprot:ctg_3521.g636
MKAGCVRLRLLERRPGPRRAT